MVILNFKIKNFFETIIDSHVLFRNNAEILYILYLICPNSNNLPNFHTASQTQVQFILLAGFIGICVCLVLCDLISCVDDETTNTVKTQNSFTMRMHVPPIYRHSHPQPWQTIIASPAL